MYAGGSPQPDIKMDGKTLVASQANNMCAHAMLHAGCTCADSCSVAAGCSALHRQLGSKLRQRCARYIFPGLAMGAHLGDTGTITDSMLTAASEALPGMIPDDIKAKGCVYPPLSNIRCSWHGVYLCCAGS